MRLKPTPPTPHPRATMNALHSPCLFTLLTATLLAAISSAQELQVPSQFPTIQAAIDAAGADAVIVVQPGSYDPIDICGKDLTIRPASGSFTITPDGNGNPIHIKDVAFGDTVTIIGAHIPFNDPNFAAVRAEFSQGAVRLSGLDVVQTSNLPHALIQACVEVEEVATFWLIDSSIWGPGVAGNTTVSLSAGNFDNDGISGIQFLNAHGVIQNSRSRGYDNDLGLSDFGYAGDGVRAVEESTVWLLQDAQTPDYLTTFRGGDGVLGGHAVHQVRDPIRKSRITACGGDFATVMLKYVGGTGTTVNGGLYAFNNDNGIRIFPVPCQNPPCFITFYTIVQHCKNNQKNESVALSNQVSIGTNLEISIKTVAPRKYVTFFNAATVYAASVPMFTGRAMFNGAAVIGTRVGTTTAGVAQVLSVPIPNNPNLIGTQVTAQTITGPMSGPYDNFGLPAWMVIVP